MRRGGEVQFREREGAVELIGIEHRPPDGDRTLGGNFKSRRLGRAAAEEILNAGPCHVVERELGVERIASR